MLCTVCICCAQLAQQNCIWIWNSEHYKDKKASFLFSLRIIGVCSLKKITSWIQVTSKCAGSAFLERWISGYLTKGLHLCFASFWKSAQQNVSLSFFSLAFITVSVCLNSHPVRLSANGKQISLLAKRSDLCFCCPGKPCWEKESFWFDLVGKRADLYLIKSSHTNKWETLCLSPAVLHP